MALDVSGFLDELIDALENYNRAHYSTQQVVRFNVCGRVKQEGDITINLAGVGESTIHITPDEDDRQSVAQKISEISQDVYDVKLSGSTVTFSQKGSQETISDDYGKYEDVTIYGNLGNSSYSTGETGINIVFMEVPGYACDFDEEFNQEGITIRERIKNAMEPFYSCIFDAIWDFRFAVAGIPAVSLPVSFPITTAMVTVPTHTSTTFAAEMAKINMEREGVFLNPADKARAEAARAAFAAPFEAWFLTTVYTIPSHQVSPIASVASPTQGTVPYSGSNSSQVNIEFKPLKGSALATPLATAIGLTEPVAIEFLTLICNVLADHINNNWEIGSESGSIDYSGTSNTAGVATAASTTEFSDINK